ncbi:MAG: hypothetical protein DRN57_01375 [Thermoplasmata archaeon]|nr:MAG: hypothetical protein DRN57_01375 [Thermoplasmata archaeon]
MDDLELYRKLSELEMPVLSFGQIKALLEMNNAGAAVKLNFLVKKGVLKRVIRGRYSLPETHPLCISSNIENPSYISLWAALEYHELTTQSPRIIDIMNTRRSETIVLDHDMGSFDLRFIKVKPGRMFGYKKEYLGNHSCFIADPERTVVDCLLYHNYVPLEEVMDAINGEMDVNTIVRYTNIIGKQSLKKRMGFILEKKGFEVEPEIFGHLTSTYTLLYPAGERRGKYNTRWHIIQNGVKS